MLQVKTNITNIPTKGLSLMAGEFIKKGTDIWVYEFGDKIIPFELWKDLPELKKNFIKKYGWRKRNEIICGIDDIRFANHSYEPNTVTDGFLTTASRDIDKGEEITINYIDLCDWAKEDGLSFEVK